MGFKQSKAVWLFKVRRDFGQKRIGRNPNGTCDGLTDIITNTVFNFVGEGGRIFRYTFISCQAACCFVNRMNLMNVNVFSNSSMMRW